MNARGRILFRLIAGGYLAYLGFDLAVNCLKDRPEHYMLLVIVGVVFLILGAFFVITSVRQYMKNPFVEESDDETADEDRDIDEEE